MAACRPTLTMAELNNRRMLMLAMVAFVSEEIARLESAMHPADRTPKPDIVTSTPTITFQMPPASHLLLTPPPTVSPLPADGVPSQAPPSAPTVPEAPPPVAEVTEASPTPHHALHGVVPPSAAAGDAAVPHRHYVTFIAPPTPLTLPMG
jgi:hypothetical protein